MIHNELQLIERVVRRVSPDLCGSADALYNSAAMSLAAAPDRRSFSTRLVL